MDEDLIECVTLFGKKKHVPKSSITFRPSAYGVIVKDGKVLVVNTKSTGKLFIPGGGIDLNETIEEGLKREIYEEVGLDVEVERFIHFNENYFYYDPQNEGFHSYQYFFLCIPKHDLRDDHIIDDLEAESPNWISIDDLHEGNIQGVEMGILPVIRKLLSNNDEEN